ncbi:hypothetical protein AXF42_Ash020842 [Apostasia shenzhenica]|uniref:Uncharacterized protein n=1 Tax=Apostasia shenzhenica TaxID=1088818 RepID=A0A2I0A3C8_9ASPA|nr:hypothetical protein AXF42_Ash020842 [Apostasia shenzhenica]
MLLMRFLPEFEWRVYSFRCETMHVASIRTENAEGLQVSLVFLFCFALDLSSENAEGLQVFQA